MSTRLLLTPFLKENTDGLFAACDEFANASGATLPLEISESSSMESYTNSTLVSKIENIAELSKSV